MISDSAVSPQFALRGNSHYEFRNECLLLLKQGVGKIKILFQII